VILNHVITIHLFKASLYPHYLKQHYQYYHI